MNKLVLTTGMQKTPGLKGLDLWLVPLLVVLSVVRVASTEYLMWDYSRGPASCLAVHWLHCSPYIVERVTFVFTVVVVVQSCPPLWLHGLQHARLPCPSLSPWVCSNSCPLSRWCHPTILSSVALISSCPQSFPELGSFPMSQLFTSGWQSIGALVSVSVLAMSIQSWFPLGWSGLISLLSKTTVIHTYSEYGFAFCSCNTSANSFPSSWYPSHYLQERTWGNENWYWGDSVWSLAWISAHHNPTV